MLAIRCCVQLGGLAAGIRSSAHATTTPPPSPKPSPACLASPPLTLRSGSKRLRSPTVWRAPRPPGPLRSSTSGRRRTTTASASASGSAATSPSRARATASRCEQRFGAPRDTRRSLGTPRAACSARRTRTPTGRRPTVSSARSAPSPTPARPPRARRPAVPRRTPRLPHSGLSGSVTSGSESTRPRSAWTATAGWAAVR